MRGSRWIDAIYRISVSVPAKISRAFSSTLSVYPITAARFLPRVAANFTAPLPQISAGIWVIFMGPIGASLLY